jgi:hypothetical protein
MRLGDAGTVKYIALNSIRWITCLEALLTAPIEGNTCTQQLSKQTVSQCGTMWTSAFMQQSLKTLLLYVMGNVNQASQQSVTEVAHDAHHGSHQHPSVLPDPHALSWVQDPCCPT